MSRKHFYEEKPRRIHFFVDQQGATYQSMGSTRKYANTACKGNYDSPDLRTTSDATKVTCLTCLKKMATPQQMPVPERLTVAEALATHKRYRYRRSWRGKLILQIEETVPYNYDPQHDTKPGGYTQRWRDATLADLGVGVA